MSTFGEADWDAFVAARPDATFFHRSAWRRVASEVFGHEAHYLTLSRNGALAAVLPLVEVRSRLFGHALISNAFCTGGGPLAIDAAARAVIIRQAEQLGRGLGVDYVELRDTGCAGAGWTERGGLYAGFEKPISSDPEQDLRAIPRRQRAVLRRAMSYDLVAEVETSVEHFYPLYARTMRNHGTPSLPRRFFETLLETFGADCEVMTVRHAGRPVSSVLSYFSRDRAMPYYTGSTQEARKLGANDFMYWRLMRRGVERGCTVFDMGRSKVGAGPYAYKRNWGFVARPIVHQFRPLACEDAPEINPANPRYATLIKAWRRLPLPLATAVSPLLSRGLG